VALESIGFSWDTKEELWESGFSALTSFALREGHCLVPPNHIENDIKLTSWVHHQKALAARGKIPQEKLARLKKIGFVQDSFLRHREETALSALRSFKAREGHVNVPRAHLENGFRLGAWVTTRRVQMAETSTELKTSLDALGFVWKPYEASFWETLKLVEQWIQENGTTLLPSSEVYRGVKVGLWLNNLRNRYRAGELSPDRISAVEALGIPWSPVDTKWLILMNAFTSFHSREGHLRVPLKFVEGGVPIGSRLNYLRSAYRKKILSETQIKDLENLGIVWDPLEEQWQRGLSALREFRQAHGHAQVPYDYEHRGFPLGVWRNAKIGARRRGQLEPRKIQELDELDFIWKVNRKGSR
jgi:hypothetical protein